MANIIQALVAAVDKCKVKCIFSIPYCHTFFSISAIRYSAIVPLTVSHYYITDSSPCWKAPALITNSWVRRQQGNTWTKETQTILSLSSFSIVKFVFGHVELCATWLYFPVEAKIEPEFTEPSSSPSSIDISSYNGMELLLAYFVLLLSCI